MRLGMFLIPTRVRAATLRRLEELHLDPPPRDRPVVLGPDLRPLPDAMRCSTVSPAAPGERVSLLPCWEDLPRVQRVWLIFTLISAPAWTVWMWLQAMKLIGVTKVWSIVFILAIIVTLLPILLWVARYAGLRLVEWTSVDAEPGRVIVAAANGTIEFRPQRDVAIIDTALAFPGWAIRLVRPDGRCETVVTTNVGVADFLARWRVTPASSAPTDRSSSPSAPPATDAPGSH